MTFSPAASIFPFGKDGNTMTERAKKTLATIGMELGFLLLKLFALATLIVPLALFLFVATWEGGQIGYFVAFFTVVAYFSLALLLIVWWPFHKYAYSKLSRRGKGRLWSFVAVMLAATSFMLFTYRAVDERTFPAGMETFRVVVRDTYWNRIFRNSGIVPFCLVRDYDVTIYTADNDRIGNYSYCGRFDYSIPHYFLDKEGTPVTRDGGYELYLEAPAISKLRHRKGAPIGKWEQIRRILHKKFLDSGVTTNTLTIIPLPCTAAELRNRVNELGQSRFQFSATVSTDGTSLIVTRPAEYD